MTVGEVIAYLVLAFGFVITVVGFGVLLMRSKKP